MATLPNDTNDQNGKQTKFNVQTFIKELDPNYKFEIHKLEGFLFDESHKDINKDHYIICIHNFLNSKESALYQKNTRKICDKDLMKHGSRRHALYFNIDDSGLSKQIYRYGKQDWKMNNGIPEIIQNKLLTKIKKKKKKIQKKI